MQQFVQPLLAASAANDNTIVNFRMIGSPRLAKAQRGEWCFASGGGEGAKRQDQQLYTTLDDVQIQRANFLQRNRRTGVERMLPLSSVRLRAESYNWVSS